jgi:type IV secretory pathway VirB10-like protein
MSKSSSDAQSAAGEAMVQALSSPYSKVSRKDSPWGFLAGLAGVLGLGLIVYISLSAGRHAKAQVSAAPPSPIPAAIAPAPPPQVTVPTPAPPPDAFPPSMIQSDESARAHAPSMIVDLSEAPEAATATPGAGGTAAAATPGAATGKEQAGGGARDRSNEGFAERVSSGAQADTAHAGRLANTALIAAQGTVISAVLETGINSDLPGFVRAVVSRDVSGFDGSTVLIPRGSKLIGEYKSGMAVGQSRAFVIWSRLITPSGVTINLGSPATDRLGRGGVDGETNTHFVRRFGAAILLSVINAGLDYLANQASNNNNSAVIVGTPQAATNIATVALQRDIDIPPTITVPQGQAIRVFVARDLDFSDVIGGK